MTDEQSNALAEQMAAESDEELLLVIGTHELQGGSSFILGWGEGITLAKARESAIRLGLIVLDTNNSVRAVVCRAENKKVIGRVVDVSHVGSLATAIAPVWGGGGADHAQVAPPVIALATLILRIGINEYCRGRRAAKPASTPRPASTAQPSRKSKKRAKEE